MTALLKDFCRDDAGLILSAELVIILTIAVLGMIVGLANLQTALLGEFADLGLAFQSLNQSYSTPSYHGCWKWWGRTSWVAGSRFIDVFDGCVGYGVGGCEIYGGSNYPPSVGVPAVTCPATTTGVTVPGPGCSDATSAQFPAGTSAIPGGSLQPVPQGTALEPPCVNCP